MARGARGMGPGWRANRAPSPGRRLRHLHAGQQAGSARVAARVVRRAARGGARRRRDAGRTGGQHRHEPAVARRRRRSAAQPRAHARLERSDAGWKRRTRSRSRGDHRADPDAAVQEDRRRRSRYVPAAARALRSRDEVQRGPRGARLRALVRRGAARPARAYSTRRTDARGSRCSRSPTSATRSGCSSCRCS